MLDQLTNKTTQQIEAILAYLSWGEFKDAERSDPSSAISTAISKNKLQIVESSTEHRFRHCAVISHLYALYEYLVEMTLDSILDKYPRYFSYESLDDSLKNTHRTNLGAILQKLDHRKFRELDEKNVLSSYLGCVEGEKNWSFVSEAIRLRSANLRSEELSQQFGHLGMKSFWSLVSKQKPLADFFREFGETRAANLLLDDFVELRNESGHGLPDTLLGNEQLRFWCNFIGSLCESIALAALYSLAKIEIKNGNGLLGVAAETFPKLGNVCILTCSGGSLKIGDIVYSLKPTEIRRAVILSLQIDDEDVEGVSVLKGPMEVGIRTDAKVLKNSKLVSLSC